MRKLGLCLCLLLLTGCAAKSVDTNGLKVKTSREKPTGNCAELGEVTGAQGNWFTGPYTSIKTCMTARSTICATRPEKWAATWCGSTRIKCSRGTKPKPSTP